MNNKSVLGCRGILFGLALVAVLYGCLGLAVLAAWR
jgi:hypothetical protein